jgi:hypothetical protein
MEPPQAMDMHFVNTTMPFTSTFGHLRLRLNAGPFCTNHGSGVSIIMYKSYDMSWQIYTKRRKWFLKPSEIVFCLAIKNFSSRF